MTYLSKFPALWIKECVKKRGQTEIVPVKGFGFFF